MAKKQHGNVRNWRKYSNSLIQRGSLTLWVDEKSIKSWYAKLPGEKTRGRPQKYSDSAILMILTLKQVFHLTFRSSQGFVKSLLATLGVNIEVPCYTQVCRRQGFVKLPLLPVSRESIHLVIDSSGLKLFGEGEWKVRQHGFSKHRLWRKLHIGVDEKSQLIVTAELTGNDCGDDKRLPTLLERYKGAVRKVSADGAYDSHACYETIDKRGAIPLIPPQPNPTHKQKQREAIKRPRDEVVWQVQQQGMAEWKKSSGYHRRSLVETAFYRYKQLLGDKLRARKFENQSKEALLGCHILNTMMLMNAA